MTELIVNVKQGQLKGSVFTSVDGCKYLAFTGVPYAEPPVRKLRFKEPRPLKPWIGVRDATQESKKAAQFDSRTKKVVGSDDCLYLNIVTSSLSGKRPVMVWIHGGAFSIGSNSFELYSPDYLVKKDIVFVGVNYRLGVLGFLNMDHKDCPGNQGLKDQCAALQWVRENIEVFGGDSENVTIMGTSAGAASAHYLCLSPIAKGLFHKAILQSGVGMNPWAIKGDLQKRGYELAEALGEECYSSEEVIEYLRTFPADKIVDTWHKMHPKHIPHLAPIFVPSIDSNSVNPIFSQPRDEMLREGINVPVMFGNNSEEGIGFFLVPRPDLFQDFNNNFNQKLMDLMNVKFDSKLHEITKEIRRFYFGEEAITDNQMDNMVKFLGDISMVNGIQLAAEIQMQKSTPTYLYVLSHPPKYSIKNQLKVRIEGTCHGDELCLLFHSPLQCRGGKLEKDSKDYALMESMTQMWTDFAKTGNPTPTTSALIPAIWKPLTKDSKNYFRISENLTSGIYPSETWSLWKRFFTEIKYLRSSQTSRL